MEPCGTPCTFVQLLNVLFILSKKPLSKKKKKKLNGKMGKYSSQII